MPSTAVHDRGTTWTRRAEKAQVYGVVVAVMGLILTSLFSFLAYLAAKDSERIAGEALTVAREAHELSVSTEEEELARQFYIGGIPADVTPTGDVAEEAVINTGSVDMYNVQVMGSYIGQEARVSIGTFPACSGRTLPEGFRATKMNFTDGTVDWERWSNGPLEKEGIQASLFDRQREAENRARTPSPTSPPSRALNAPLAAGSQGSTKALESPSDFKVSSCP